MFAMIPFISTSTSVFPLVIASIRAQTTVKWQGETWYVKSSKAEGPGPNDWDARNAWVDAKGYLHMKISNINGHWACAEIWTARPLGFGVYQCQVEGRLDKLDPNVVFSMFSYAGPDGVNEIDIEYAKWGNAKEKNGWWTVWPNDSQGEKATKGFNFTLDGSYTTLRYAWSKDEVRYWMLGGHQRIDSNTNLMQEWSYRPNQPEHQIDQTAMPLHFNLWLFQGKPPRDGQPVEVVIHSFIKK